MSDYGSPPVHRTVRQPPGCPVVVSVSPLSSTSPFVPVLVTRYPSLFTLSHFSKSQRIILIKVVRDSISPIDINRPWTGTPLILPLITGSHTFRLPPLSTLYPRPTQSNVSFLWEYLHSKDRDNSLGLFPSERTRDPQLISSYFSFSYKNYTPQSIGSVTVRCNLNAVVPTPNKREI